MGCGFMGLGNRGRRMGVPRVATGLGFVIRTGSGTARQGRKFGAEYPESPGTARWPASLEVA